MTTLANAIRRDNQMTWQEYAAVGGVKAGHIYCRTYWGTHGCGRPRYHEPPHICIDEWDSDPICSIMEPDQHHYGEDTPYG